MYATGVPYAVLYSSNTLVFTYDEDSSYSPGGMITAVWSGTEVTASGDEPGWYSYRANIEKVIFYESFENVTPNSTAKWFSECSNLTEIVGLKYLNTCRAHFLIPTANAARSFELNFEGEATGIGYQKTGKK